MAKHKWLPLIFFFMLVMPAVYPQQGNAADAAKKKEQVKKADKKAYQKARKLTLKHRRDIQSKETRKHMDETNKRADAYNRENDKKWWQKILKRHHRK